MKSRNQNARRLVRGCRRSVALGWLLWVAFACASAAACDGGCGEQRSAPAPSASPAPPRRAPADAGREPETARARERDQASARVQAVSGAVSLEGGGTLSPGAGLPLQQTVEVEQDGSLTLDMPRGARVTVSGPARLRVGTDRLRQLIVARGVLVVQFLPQGGKRRLSLRVATPLATIELAGHAEAWIGVASAARGTYLGLASGSATAATGREGAMEREGLDVAAGQGWYIERGAEGPGAPEAVGRTLESVAAAGAKALARFEALPEAPARAKQASSEDGLERALSSFDALRAEGERISAEQRRAKEGGDSAKAKLAQKSLVEYAQRLYRMRRRILVAWERRQAAALASGKSQELAVQAQRMRAAIGAASSW